MRLTLIFYFIFLISTFLVLFVSAFLLSKGISQLTIIEFCVLMSLPMLIATLTRFHFWFCVVVAGLWWGAWGIMLTESRGMVLNLGLLVLIFYLLVNPLFWLIPAIAGRPRRGKTETYEIEYAAYTIRKQ